MTSSASMPCFSITGRPIAWARVSIGSSCERRSSGIGGRCALYSGYSSCRNVGPGPSHASAHRSGESSRRSLRALFENPKMADVFSPRLLRSGRPMNA